jgi:hypothetical protein
MKRRRDQYNKEINKLKMKIDNIKEKVTYGMKNLRKKN